MTHERLWAVAQEPVPAMVVGAWGLLGAVIAVFIVRFRSDLREGVKAGAALVAASVALGFFIVRAREASRVHDPRVGRAIVDRSWYEASASRLAARTGTAAEPARASGDP